MATPLEIGAGITVELVVATIAIGALYRIWSAVLPAPKRQAVLPFQRGVLFKREQFEKILAPGTHWILPSRSLLLCDMRSKPFQVQGIELVTADGMLMRLSLSGEYHIVDPACFVSQSSDPFSTFYVDLRQALRSVVREQSSTTILNGQDVICARVRTQLVTRGADLGVEITALEMFESVPLGRIDHTFEPTVQATIQ